METSWNNKWESEANRAYWNEPDEYVVKFCSAHGIGPGDTVLDLGCGVGRHAIYLSKRGARVYAIDESEAAIAKLKESAASLDLDIKAEVCNYLTAQPAQEFDCIIAFNVIYHGDFLHFSRSVFKCGDLLKSNGRLFFTCPSRDDAKYGSGNKVAEHTYESLNSIHSGDVHYFTDEPELRNLMCEFDNVKIETQEHYWDNNGTQQFASNFIVTARKP